MTYVPESFQNLQAYMQIQTGLPLASLGVFPDESHDGGYHCGWDRRRISNGKLNDYAWQESPRDWNHKTNAARAFDCGLFARLRELSLWMVNECQRGAEDTLDIREIIYSPDGISVKRWDRLGMRSTGDLSHLTHTHFSFFADAETNDKTHPFQRFFEGGGMSTLGEYNQQYMIQNGVVGAEYPNVHIPAGEGHSATALPNPLAIILYALLEGEDAQIPPYLNMDSRIIKNAMAQRLDAIEAKLDQILAMGPGTGGGASAAQVREIVRAELDKTGFRAI